MKRKQWLYVALLVVPLVSRVSAAQSEHQEHDTDIVDMVLDEEQALMAGCGYQETDQDGYDLFCDQTPEQEVPRWQVWLTIVGSSAFAYGVAAKNYISLRIKRLHSWLLIKYRLFFRVVKRSVLTRKRQKLVTKRG